MSSSSDTARDVHHAQQLSSLGVPGAVLLLSFCTAMRTARLVGTYRGGLVLCNEGVCSTVLRQQWHA